MLHIYRGLGPRSGRHRSEAAVLRRSEAAVLRRSEAAFLRRLVQRWVAAVWHTVV